MISKRLLTIAELVQPLGTVVDVGCDHGQLCSWLLDKYHDIQCIACDISQACLDKVHNRDRLSKRLGDGLDVINVSEKVHTIVIAGMGGNLMNAILDKYLYRISCDNQHNSIQLVLSPQSDAHKVRRLLVTHRCEFVKDFVLSDVDKFYDIIKVVYNGAHQVSDLTPLQLQYGVWYKSPNEALLDRLTRELAVYNQVLLHSTDSSVLQSKVDNIREVLAWQQ